MSTLIAYGKDNATLYNDGTTWAIMIGGGHQNQFSQLSPAVQVGDQVAIVGSGITMYNPPLYNFGDSISYDVAGLTISAIEADQYSARIVFSDQLSEATANQINNFNQNAIGYGSLPSGEMGYGSQIELTFSSGGGSGGGSGGSGGSGGGGSSTTPVSGAVVVGGKAVGTVSVDPRTTPVRVTIGGVEQALPAGSVVRNTATGQKFLKVAGGELEYAAISVTPPAEWSWSAAGAQGWSVLQGF